MQAWSLRSTRCLFCEFRAFQSSVSLIRRTRQYGDATARRGDRGKPNHALKDNDILSYKRKGTSRQSELQSSNSRRPGDIFISKGRSRYERYNAEDAREQFTKKVRRELDQLEDSMRTTGVEQTDHSSFLERLDSTGQRWPTFKAATNILTSKKAGLLSDDERSFIKRIKDASQKSDAELRNQLRFEFLDRCLSAMLRKSPDSAFDLRYPTEWYYGARRRQRVIHLHVGPTNSGKTYTALKRLQEAENGFYAGPLRLLAHEVYSRFRANGIPCDLVTGDDVRRDENGEASHYASTVEMVHVSREVEVAVIDEIQMLGNEERGWAWTRAFLGANAAEVHLCGEIRVIPLIKELTASMGDTLKIHRYERLNPLKVQSKSLSGNLKRLQKGDCIVCFSVMGIHALKKQIELETGRRVAIVYGSLPPETRATQAELFNDPNNDYDFLVASDAIGMGLNLSIRRIIFETTIKYNGQQLEPLTIPQIKQIAGRAGRYRTARQDKFKDELAESQVEPGLVSCLEDQDLPVIRAALDAEAPPLRKAMILPPVEYLEEYSLHLPQGVPFEYLFSRVCQTAKTHPRFAVSNIRDKLKIARITDVVPNLTIEDRAQITACPMSGRDERIPKCLQAMAKAIADRRAISIVDIPEMPLEVLAEKPSADRSYLASLEVLHSTLTMFLWLSYRFITFLKDQPMAFHAKELTEQRISWTLTAFSANPKLREKIMADRMKIRKEALQPVSTDSSGAETSGKDTDGIVLESIADSAADLWADQRDEGAVRDERVDAREEHLSGDETCLPTDHQWDEKGPSDSDEAPQWEERSNNESFITGEEERAIERQKQTEVLQQSEQGNGEDDPQHQFHSLKNEMEDDRDDNDKRPQAASAGS